MRDKITQISIIIGVLLISLSVFYYFVIFLPQKEKIRFEQQQAELNFKIKQIEKEMENKEKAKEKLDKCLATAQENYKLAWNSTCSNGIGDWINICQGEQGENCTQCILSDEEADRLNLLLEKDKDECYKRYPQK